MQKLSPSARRYLGLGFVVAFVLLLGTVPATANPGGTGLVISQATGAGGNSDAYTQRLRSRSSTRRPANNLRSWTVDPVTRARAVTMGNYNTATTSMTADRSATQRRDRPSRRLSNLAAPRIPLDRRQDTSRPTTAAGRRRGGASANTADRAPQRVDLQFSTKLDERHTERTASTSQSSTGRRRGRGPSGPIVSSKRFSHVELPLKEPHLDRLHRPDQITRLRRPMPSTAAR